MENQRNRDLDFILHHAATSLSRLAGCKVFIFGGTGFIGKWLLESLIAFNRQSTNLIEISVLSRNPQKFCDEFPHLHQGVQFYEGDVESFRFPAGTFDFVVHGATDISLDTLKNRDRRIVETMRRGTQAVLNFCRKAEVGRLLLLSSGAVYGVIPTDMIRVKEDFAQSSRVQRPLTAYGEGKRVSEQMCAGMAEENDIEIMIARCFTLAGPYLPLDAHFAIGNFLRNALAGETIRIKGDGTQLRSYLYTADLVVWLLRILTHGKNLYPYNVGSPEYLSIRELAFKVRQVVGGSDLLIEQSLDSLQPPARYVPAVGRASRDLKLTAWTDIDQILLNLNNWYQQSA